MTKTEKKKQDTYSYKGWLVSDYFIKRVLALIGYGYVSALLAAVPVAFIALMIYQPWFLLSVVLIVIAYILGLGAKKTKETEE